MEGLSVAFVLRSKKSGGLTDVHCRLTIRGERLVYSTKKKILPTYWSNKRLDKLKFNWCKPAMRGHDQFNQDLRNFHLDADRLFSRFVADNKRVPTLIELKTALDSLTNNNVSKEPIRLMEYWSMFIERRRQQMVNDARNVKGNTTLTGLKQTQNLLLEFAAHAKLKLDFNSISLEFYQKWIDYMTDIKGYKPSNTGKHIKTLKTVMNSALEDAVTDNRAHHSKYFKVVNSDSFAIALSEDEIQAMFELDLSDSRRLDVHRDAFVVACSTGLRHSDLVKLTRSNIVKDGGRLYIQIKTQKTNEVVTIPVDERVKAVLDKYEGTERGFPKASSNPVMNRDLKTIGAKVDVLQDVQTINQQQGGKQVTLMKRKCELVTTHTARRSFATNYYNLGVSPQVIMKVTGHKTESSFFKYIRITPLESAKVFEMFMDRRTLKVV